MEANLLAETIYVPNPYAPAVPFQQLKFGRAYGLYLSHSLITGMISGTIAGTCTILVFGTFFGLIIGGLVGLGGAVIIGPFVAHHIVTNSYSPAAALRQAQRTAALAMSFICSLIGVYELVGISTTPSDLLLTAISIGLGALIIIVGAAQSAAATVMGLGDFNLRNEFKRGLHGPRVSLKPVCFLSCLPVAVWILAAVMNAR